MKALAQKVLPISFWYTLHLLAVVNIVAYSLPQFHNKITVTYPSANDVLKHILKDSGLSFLSSPISLALVAFFIFSIIFGSAYWLLGKMLKRFSIENLFRLTFDAITWSVRIFFVSGIFLISAFLLTALLFLIEGKLYLFTVAVIWLLYFAGAPILILNRQFLVSEHFGGWYRIRWPGWRIVLMYLVGVVMLVEIDTAIDQVFTSWLNTAVSIAWYVVDLFLYGVLLSLYLHQRSFQWIAKEIRARSNLRFIITWMLLDLRFALFTLWLLPPILLGAIAYFYVIPQYVTTVSSIGQVPDHFLSVFNAFASVLKKNLELILLSCSFLMLMIKGRYLVLYDNLSR